MKRLGDELELLVESVFCTFFFLEPQHKNDKINPIRATIMTIIKESSIF
jgi:hypothetical protein